MEQKAEIETPGSSSYSCVFTFLPDGYTLTNLS